MSHEHRERRECGCVIVHKRVEVCARHGQLPEEIRDRLSEMVSNVMADEIKAAVQLEHDKVVVLELQHNALKAEKDRWASAYAQAYNDLDAANRLLEESRKVVAQLSAAMNHLAPETGPVRKLVKENIDIARDYLNKFEKRCGLQRPLGSRDETCILTAGHLGPCDFALKRADPVPKSEGKVIRHCESVYCVSGDKCECACLDCNAIENF